MRKRICSYAILLFLTVSPGPLVEHAYPAAGKGPSHAGANENLAFLVFDANPDASYQVQKNGSDLTAVISSGAGVFTFNDFSASGDRFSFLTTGSNPQPPSRPAGLTVMGSDVGCAQCDWIRNPEGNIVGYRIYFGTTSVQQGAAVAYDDSVDAGNSIHYNLCGLIEGSYYFAIRAVNAFGLMSPYSQEESAYVGGGAAQGPTPPQQVAVVESNPGCAVVSWRANSEPDIAGYKVFFGPLSVAGQEAQEYADSVDAGSATSREICALAEGRYYFAVKAYNTLGLYSPFSTERSLDIIGEDTAAPVFSNIFPVNGSVDVPINTGISFAVEDLRSGVDTNLVAVSINGQPAALVRFTGSAERYSVSCWPQQSLPLQTVVTIDIIAGDLAVPANTDSTAWSFTTGAVSDATAPSFCCLNPPNGAAEVGRFSDITIGISDGGSGIDFGSLRMFINSIAADFTRVGDDNKDILLVYRNTEGFALGSTMEVTVQACDLSDPANCATLADYSFVVTNVPDELAQAIIVPDGFWANSPEKPLEIRNMPLGWTVRIFNTAGLQVKSFKNTVREGYDWFWDFTNEHKRTVVRALYLVRVTDSSGRVRKAGRFLVQKAP